MTYISFVAKTFSTITPDIKFIFFLRLFIISYSIFTLKSGPLKDYQHPLSFQVCLSKLVKIMCYIGSARLFIRCNSPVINCVYTIWNG